MQTHATDHPGIRFTPQLLMGLLIIIVGILFTLDNLGLTVAERYIRYWPAGLIGLGALKLWQSRGASAFGALVLITVGTWLLLDSLGLVRVRFWEMWPLLLVLFGASMVWQGLRGPRHLTTSETNDTLSALAVLSGVNRGNNSRAFKGGDLTAVMGGCEIDLRQAAIEGEAVFDVFAMWGGIEIRVPENWTVDGRVTPLIGGFDDKTRPPQQRKPAAPRDPGVRDHGRRRGQELTVDASHTRARQGARPVPCRLGAGRHPAGGAPPRFRGRELAAIARDRASAVDHVRVLLSVRVVRVAQHAALGDRRVPRRDDRPDRGRPEQRCLACARARLDGDCGAPRRPRRGGRLRRGVLAALRVRPAAVSAVARGELSARIVRAVARDRAAGAAGAGARA